MIIKNLLIIKLSLVLFASSLFAQQDALYSQYIFNPLIINPAYAGSKGVLSGVLVYRDQWTGITGAPVTQTLSIHGPLRNKKIGLGLHVFNDKIGSIRLMGLVGSYAYRISLGQSKLSLGIQAGIYQHKVNYSELNIYNSNDNVFLQGESAKFMPDLNFGIYYYSNRYYFGAIISHLIGQEIFQSGDNTNNMFQLVKHYRFIAGYALPLNENIIFKPSCMINYTDKAPINLDINTGFLFYKKLEPGLSFRTSNALVFFIEYNIKDNLGIGYSYDYNLSKFMNHKNGSHEFMVTYDINIYKKKIMLPR